MRRTQANYLSHDITRIQLLTLFFGGEGEGKYYCCEKFYLNLLHVDFQIFPLSFMVDMRNSLEKVMQGLLWFGVEEGRSYFYLRPCL